MLLVSFMLFTLGLFAMFVENGIAALICFGLCWMILIPTCCIKVRKIMGLWGT